MDGCLNTEASVETFDILVVPTLTGTGVPVVLLATEASGVCSVAALGDATEPPLLSIVTLGDGTFGWLEVAATGVALILMVGMAPLMTEVGAVGLFATVDACGWVGAGLSVGLGVAVVVIGSGLGLAVVTAAVGFADIGACVGTFF